MCGLAPRAWRRQYIVTIWVIHNEPLPCIHYSLCRFSFSSLCLLSIDRLFLEGDWVIAQASRGRKKPIGVRSHIKEHTESSSFQNTESIQRKKNYEKCLPELHRHCQRYPSSWPIESSIISNPFIFWCRSTLLAQDGSQSSIPINRIR